MSVNKATTATTKKRPEWALKILGLRRRMGLSQTGMGARLHYSAMAVSRWERGTKEPPANCYIQLGNLAGDPECWSFWSRAGLKSADISRLLPQGGKLSRKTKFPDFEVAVAGSGGRRAAPPTKIKLVAIPVLPIHAATRGEVGDQELDLRQVTPEQMIAAPAVWCPNPGETSCLRVKGSSMNPSIDDGDIVAVDCARSDPVHLSGKIVVAWHREHGLSLSRLLVVKGVHLLVSENRLYDPIVIGKDRNWRIVGKVLWWIRQAP
jgi:hypothetical protein